MHLCFELRHRNSIFPIYCSQARVQAEKALACLCSCFQVSPTALCSAEAPPGVSTVSNCSWCGFCVFSCPSFRGLLIGIWEKLLGVAGQRCFTPFSLVVNILTLCISLLKLFQKQFLFLRGTFKKYLSWCFR